MWPARCPGSQANTGQTVAGGVRLMAEQLNRSGGLLGYRVKVVALDDEADSDVAAKVAEQVKEAVERGDKVLGVIGHPNSGQTAAAMAIYKDLPIIVITPTASEVGLTHQGYRNFFRVNAATMSRQRSAPSTWCRSWAPRRSPCSTTTTRMASTWASWSAAS